MPSLFYRLGIQWGMRILEIVECLFEWEWGGEMENKIISDSDHCHRENRL